MFTIQTWQPKLGGCSKHPHPSSATPASAQRAWRRHQKSSCTFTNASLKSLNNVTRHVPNSMSRSKAFTIFHLARGLYLTNTRLTRTTPLQMSDSPQNVGLFFNGGWGGVSSSRRNCPCLGGLHKDTSLPLKYELK